jgi:ATP-dependent Clp protease ATP-binding subunit ClpB
MVRIDMSEYMEKHSVARLIGAPPCYVGYEEGGYLKEAVRRRPYSVILLDEIEKAHPDVFNVLLQVLDDGRMTDGKGRTVDFKNTILIMTSNLGSQLIMRMATDGVEKKIVQQQIDDLLHAQFKPEFLNRIDEIIIFDSLQREDLLAIVDIQLKKLTSRLAAKDITLHVRKSAKEFLVDTGYNASYGARPLKRAIQRHLEDLLAMKLLEGEFTDRDHIIVEGSSSGLHLSRQSKSQ